jgi:hypothetical protein
VFFEPKKVVLRDERTKADRRFLTARYKRKGDLVFEGQDIGEGVKAFWGCTEYEWTWTVKAQDIPKLMSALNVRRRLLTEIKRRFSGPDASRVETFLKESTAPYLFWSRVGD